jgi:hypothetical protein
MMTERNAKRSNKMTAPTPSRLQRFLWRCAAVDSDTMLDEKTPNIDRIKYTIVGALVAMTALVATVGWTYKFSLIFIENTHRIPLSVLFGIGMGLLVFLSELTLIAFIPAMMSAAGRCAAFSWRAVLAAISAALMTLPPTLGYFQNEVFGHLDDKRLALMADKRKKVDEVFGLSGLGVSVENTQRAIATNRKAQAELPPHVIELEARSTACDGEYQKLRASVAPRLGSAIAERRQVSLELESDGDQTPDRLRRRLKELNSLITGFTSALTSKTQACSSIARQASTARTEYYANLESERQGLQQRKAQQQTSLDEAQRDAKPVLSQSDESVRRRTLPDLSAQVQSLYELGRRSPFIMAVVACFYIFFLMIELLPIIAKLTSRSIYERLLAAREKKIFARIDADVAIVLAQTEIQKAEALAQLAGSRHFFADSAVRLYSESAASQARIERDRAEVLAEFEQVVAVVAGFDRAHSAVDDIAARHGRDAILAPEIERIRSMLHAAMGRAAEILGTRFGSARARRACTWQRHQPQRLER